MQKMLRNFHFALVMISMTSISIDPPPPPKKYSAFNKALQICVDYGLPRNIRCRYPATLGYQINGGIFLLYLVLT